MFLVSIVLILWGGIGLKTFKSYSQNIQLVDKTRIEAYYSYMNYFIIVLMALMTLIALFCADILSSLAEDTLTASFKNTKNIIKFNQLMGSAFQQKE